MIDRRTTTMGRSFLLRSSTALALVLATLGFSRAAEAQTTLPMPEPAPAEPGDNEGDELRYEAPGSIKLFDGRRAISTYDLFGGPTLARSIHQDSWTHSGFELGIGRSVEAHSGIFYIAGQTALLLRAIDNKSFAFSYTTNTIATGIRVGPLDIHTRVGMSLLTLDTIHANFSFELISPRAAAGVGLRLGKLNVSLEANSEYLWRWLGPSYYVRGVTLTLGLDGGRPKGPLDREQERDDNRRPNPALPVALPGIGQSF